MTYKPGTYIIVDPMGRVVRTSPIITSWAARTYLVLPNGKLKRVA